MQQTFLDPIPCPQCDRTGFIRCTDDVFKCVYCDYVKRLPDEHWQTSGRLWLLAIAAFLAVLVISALT